MKKIFKRFGAMFLVVAMLIAMIPMTVLADKPESQEKRDKGFYVDAQLLEKGSNISIDNTIMYWQNSNKKGTFKYTINGGGEQSASENGLVLSDLGLGTGSFVTVKEYTENGNNPMIVLEKRTGGYVDDEKYSTGTVTEGNVIKYYNENGEQINFECYYGENKISGESNPNSFEIPKGMTRTYNIAFTKEEEPEVYKVILTDAPLPVPTINPETVLADDCTYDGQLKNLITTFGKTAGGDIYFAIGTKKYVAPSEDMWFTEEDAEDAQREDAGKYYVWYKVDGYDDVYADIAPTRVGSVTIAKAKVELPKENNNLVYNGENRVGIEYGKEYDDPDSVIDARGTANATNAGIYSCRFKLRDDDNYTWARNGVAIPGNIPFVITWSIAQKTAEATDFVYNKPETELPYIGEDYSADVQLKETYAGVKYEIIYKDGEGKVLGEGEVQLPGTYFVFVKVNGGNFKRERQAFPVGSFTIKGVEVIDSDNSVFVKGSEDTITIKTDGPFAKFNGLKVRKVGDKEWKKLTKGIDYTVVEGSTVVTLTNDYLKRLDAGEYELEFVYGEDELFAKVTATANFTVKAAEAPKTGVDNSNVIWMIMGILTFVALIGVAYNVYREDF